MLAKSQLASGCTKAQQASWKHSELHNSLFISLPLSFDVALAGG